MPNNDPAHKPTDPGARENAHDADGLPAFDAADWTPPDSPNPKPSKSRRVRLSTVRVDIENAFAWLVHRSSGQQLNDTREAFARVMAFLDQCERDKQRLDNALLACKTLVEVVESMEDDPQVDWLREAERLAHKALADD